MGSPAVQASRSSAQPNIDLGVPMPHYRQGSALSEYARICRMNCTTEVHALAHEVLASAASTPQQRAYAKKALAYSENAYKSFMLAFETGRRSDAMALEQGIRNGEEVCRELESYLPESARKKRVPIDQRFREFEENRARMQPLHFSQSVRGGHFVDLPESWKVSTPGGTTVSADISGGRRRYYVSNLRPGAEITITAKDFTFTAKLVGTHDAKSLRADRAIGKAEPVTTAPAPAAAPPVASIPAAPVTTTPAAVTPAATPPAAAAPALPGVRPPLVAAPSADAKAALKESAKAAGLELLTGEKPSGLYREDKLNIPADVAARNQLVEPMAVSQGATAYVFPRRFKDREANTDVSGVLFVRHRDLEPSLKSVADASANTCIRSAYKYLATGKSKIEVWASTGDAPGYEYSLRSDGSVVVRKGANARTATIYSPVFGGSGFQWKSKEAFLSSSDGRYYPAGS